MQKEDYFNIENNELINQKIETITKRKKKSIDFSKTALLVLDIQNYFLEENSHAFIPASKKIIPNIEKLINHFEANKSLVIFTRHFNFENQNSMMLKWWKDIIKKDTLDFEISSSFKKFVEIIIDKTEYDAFYHTNLKELLIENKIESLILTGVMTNLCVDCTARSGFINGFEIITINDATAAYNLELHQSSLVSLSHGISYIASTEDIIKKGN